MENGGKPFEYDRTDSATGARDAQTGNLLVLLEALQLRNLELAIENEDLRRTIAAFDQTEPPFSEIYDFAPVGFLSLDSDCRIVRINQTGARILGVAKNSAAGTDFRSLLISGVQDTFAHHVRQCLGTRKRQSCELKLQTAADQSRHIQLESRAVFDEQNKRPRIRSAMIDITARKNAEERVSTLSRELLTAHEEERRLIACELHGRLAQQISAIKMSCDHILSENEDIPGEGHHRLRQMSVLLAGVIADVRDLSATLMPAGLKSGDMARCLFDYCRDFSRKTGLVVEFFSAGLEDLRFDELVQVNIYRLAQEGLSNIHKHARATHVSVTCSLVDRDIVLRIIDDGRGFDVPVRLNEITAEKLLGIRSMEERAALLGGIMTVESAPGQGTRVLVRFPYRQKIHG